MLSTHTFTIYGMAQTRAQRRTRARLAAHVLHSKHDSKELTKPARRAFLARFEREVDPEGTLPEGERRRRAEHALKAHMIALAVKSARARRQR